jgi:uncharacterized membrane protein YgdD (TMEM256/DUF423 family)
MRERLWIAIAGLSGATAVIADALAAHAPLIADNARRAAIATDLAAGARHGLFHALALLGVALLAVTGGRAAGVVASRCLGAAGWCFAAGVLLFPGSLYLIGAGAPPEFGRLAPLGGMLLIGGWLALLLFALTSRPGQA